MPDEQAASDVESSGKKKGKKDKKSKKSKKSKKGASDGDSSPGKGQSVDEFIAGVATSDLASDAVDVENPLNTPRAAEQVGGMMQQPAER